MDILSCSFSSHRQSRFNFNFEEEVEKCVRLKEILAAEIGRLVQSGVNVFYTSMTLGVEQWAASIVLGMKREHPSVNLIAVLSHETQSDKWSAEQKDRYSDTLAKCDKVVTLNKKYTHSCINECNRWLVDHAEYLLVVYDGWARWGTAYTVKYAVQKRRQIILINADSLTINSSVDYDALK